MPDLDALIESLSHARLGSPEQATLATLLVAREVRELRRAVEAHTSQPAPVAERKGRQQRVQET